jgi:DNA-binding NarL/FixJ family response regulator
MRKHSTHTHGNLQSIAEDTDGETTVLALAEDPTRYNGIPTARKQIGQLTSREIEVLQFVASGKLNKQAASELCISIKTVEKHRGHLMKKLGIRGIAGLTHFAIYAGVIECDPQMAMG